MKWRPGSTRTAIGIEIDGRSFHAVQLTGRGESRRIEAAVTLARQAPGDAVQPSDAARLNDVLYRRGFTGSHAVLAVPGPMLLSGLLELPPANSGAPIEQLARMEMSRMHRCEPQTLEMAWWELPARKRGGDAAQAMAVACRMTQADELLDIFEAAGLQVQALDVTAWAMLRAVRPWFAESGTAALLNLGWDCCSIVLVHGHSVVYERNLPEAGLKTLHALLARHLQIAPAHAASLLGPIHAQPQAEGEPEKRPSNRLRDEAQPLIEAHFETVVSELGVSCSYVSQRYDSVPFERALLMGAGARLANIDAQITEALEMQVRVAAPADVAECPPHLAQAGADPALTIALGLADHFED